MVQESILFSVIIPTFNRASLLVRAIQSIIDQDIPQVEIIIVDDGSTDNTIEKIKGHPFPALRLYAQENKGQSAARNLGVEKAKGTYIIFMDDDDEWLPQHLSQFQSAISNSHELKIYRSGFERKYSNGKAVAGPMYVEKKDGHPVKWAALNMCGLWTLCIPKEFLEKNKSPLGFPHWQDTHLILRLFAKYPFLQLPEITYRYHLHEQMGSLQHTAGNSLYDRAITNTAAMTDLFQHYGSLVQPFLPKNTLAYLQAEKFMEYAKLEILIGERKRHWELLRKSLGMKIDGRLWKHYLLFLKYLIFRAPPVKAS